MFEWVHVCQIINVSFHTQQYFLIPVNDLHLLNYHLIGGKIYNYILIIASSRKSLSIYEYWRFSGKHISLKDIIHPEVYIPYIPMAMELHVLPPIVLFVNFAYT